MQPPHPTQHQQQQQGRLYPTVPAPFPAGQQAVLGNATSPQVGQPILPVPSVGYPGTANPSFYVGPTPGGAAPSSQPVFLQPSAPPPPPPGYPSMAVSPVIFVQTPNMTEPGQLGGRPPSFPGPSSMVPVGYPQPQQQQQQAQAHQQPFPSSIVYSSSPPMGPTLMQPKYGQPSSGGNPSPGGTAGPPAPTPPPRPSVRSVRQESSSVTNLSPTSQTRSDLPLSVPFTPSPEASAPPRASRVTVNSPLVFITLKAIHHTGMPDTHRFVSVPIAKVCKEHLCRGCRHGSDCQFIHLPDPYKPFPAHVCRDYLRGGEDQCSRVRCRFFHGPVEVLERASIYLRRLGFDERHVFVVYPHPEKQDEGDLFDGVFDDVAGSESPSDIALFLLFQEAEVECAA